MTAADTFPTVHNKKWTQEHTRRVVKLREKGLTYTAIARELGFSQSTVCRNVQGVPVGGKPKKKEPPPSVAAPRRIMNSASYEPYVPSWEAPPRPGAMDYAAVRSRGI